MKGRAMSPVVFGHYSFYTSPRKVTEENTVNVLTCTSHKLVTRPTDEQAAHLEVLQLV